MNAAHDVIVIGAGPNGLVAANLLADAGVSVLVLEEQPEVGGAVRSADDLHPDYVHDTFSSFYPLAAASPAIRSLALEDHGLQWVHAPAVLGHPFPDGSWAMLHRDRDTTARLMEDQAAGDGEAWLGLCDQWDRLGPHVVGALMAPFPPVVHGIGALATIPRVGGGELIKQLLSPVINFGDIRFRGESPSILLGGNAGHSDIPPNAPGSAVFGLLMTMLGQSVGFPVPRGGSQMLSSALARRFEAAGGEIRTSTAATRIEVDRGRATGVRTQHGDVVPSRLAVLADVLAPILYERLLAPDDVPARVARGMRSFQLDPATVKVDWALSGPVPWASPPPVAPGTLHVADSLGEMAVAQAQISGGFVPARPFLLAGQMTTCDPSRSPEGTESMWAYTHVPHRTREDAGGDGIRGSWDRDDRERFADRMQARLEVLAPELGSRVIRRRVLGPRELEERNSNLLGGALNGGTSQLQQEVVLRPRPGLGRPGTGIRGLYLASSSAHPGGGVHGAPGMNAARAVLARHRPHRLLALVRSLPSPAVSTR